MAGKLNNVTVVVTRELNMTQSLNKMIASNGASHLNLPLFAIESMVNLELLQKIQQNLDQNFFTICISRNSASQVLPHISIPENTSWATIGEATAKYLESFGIKNIIFPPLAPFNGQRLIAQLQLKSINLKNLCIMILTGEDGNNALSEELQQHGAIVDSIAVYKRVMPPISAKQFKATMSTLLGPAVFLITCITSLVNLQTLAQDASINIYNMPLLVVSNRIHAYASLQGFVNITTAKSTTVEDIESALLEIGETNVRTTTANQYS